MGIGVLRAVADGEGPDLSELKSGKTVQLAVKFWHDELYNEWVWVLVDLIEEDSILGTIIEELYISLLPGGAEFKNGNPIIFEKHNIFMLSEEPDKF